MDYPILLDIHTHSIASGHGTKDTITDMAKAAARRNLQILGISDHAPAYPRAASVSYFRNLHSSFKSRFNITMLYGAELNILNESGDVDLNDEILNTLDYAIISLHKSTFKTPDIPNNDYTDAYINAMWHPKVKFLGHPDDADFPVDYYKLLSYAKEHNIYPEINNSSLSPDSYRKGGQKNSRTILSVCKELDLPVLLSSDSHGKQNVADMHHIIPLLEELRFPQSLVLNCDVERFKDIYF